MGLDMYLYLEHYESKYRIPKEELKERKKTFYPPEMKELAVHLEDREIMSKTTSYEVAYWRKANSIHRWFVDNYGGGIDECQRIYVSSQDLEKLIAICSEVLLDHDKAAELLPVGEGFFFGSYEYDEWYFKDLEDTVEQLEPVLKFVKDHDKTMESWDIVYQASW